MVEKTWLLILLLILPAFLKAQSAEEIIDYYFDTVSNGDVENWNRIRSAYIESISHYSSNEYQGRPDLMPKKPSVSKFYRVWPNKSRRDLYEDSTLVSSFFHVEKDHFFVMSNMAPMRISSGPYEPYFEFEPVIIRNVLDKAKNVKLIGVKSLQGIDCYEIRVHTKELIWHLYFNVGTFLLEFWQNSPNGDGLTLTKVYNYKRFDDYLIPMSELKTKNGAIFFSSERTKVELNLSIDPEIFIYKPKE